jgi:hypothetical protein
MSETSSCEELQKKRFQNLPPFGYIDPLDMDDRIKAIREEFTSMRRDCPYFNETVRSRCLLEPHVIFIPECNGRSFSGGVCCPKIVQSSTNAK